MKIAYLLESTGLCGGVKVVFNHVLALMERGHYAAIFSKEEYPLWFEKKVPFEKINAESNFCLNFFQSYDVVIITSLFQIISMKKELTAANSTQSLIHFVQGYEGDYKEAIEYMGMIEWAYSLDIPKITISQNLSQRLSQLYPNHHFAVCGQGLETDFFYPPKEILHPEDDRHHISIQPDTVFLVGPFEISIKRIKDGLKAFKIAQKTNPGLKLVRVSAVDTQKNEQLIFDNIHEYHVNLTPEQVGKLFRSKKGVLLSPSSPGEGFGLPPIEAMACGIPTVLTDIPSYNAFSSPNDYALFVPVNEPDRMADALIEIIRNQSKRDFLIKRGLEVAAEYSYARVAANLEAFLLNA